MGSFNFGIHRGTFAGRLLGVVALALGLASPAAVAQPQTQPADEQHAGFANERVSWQLSNVRVASPGQVMEAKEGVMTRQYVLEAEARPAQGNGEVKALFRLTMDVFSPNEDMPGQAKGQWYVQGRWTLEPDAQADANTQSELLTSAIGGRAQAALPFDPTTQSSDWQASVQIPMSRMRSERARSGARPIRGGGEVFFAAGGEGRLSVDLKLWPKL